jgi:SGNH domain (fused to AT3 domains)/Acyltransferase family
LSNFALVSATDGYFAPRTEFNPFTHTWSLAVEEQFYALYPLLIFVWTSTPLTRRRAWFWIVLIGLTLASLVWCAYASRHAPSAAYYMLAARFWELAAGGVLALCHAGLATAPPTRVLQLARRIGLPAGLVLIAWVATQADKSQFPFPWAVPAVLGTLLLIFAQIPTRGDPVPHGAWLQSRAAVAIGLRSYSLYLWHWPVYVGFRWTVGLEAPEFALVAVVLSFILAFASYRWAEQPVQRSASAAALPTRTVCLAALAIVATTWGAGQQLFSNQNRLSLSTVMSQPAAWYPTPSERVAPNDERRCSVQVSRSRHGEESVEVMSPTACPEAVTSRRLLFVLGDSHAGAYRRMLHMLVESTGLTVRVYTRAGCSVVPMLVGAAPPPPDCGHFEAWALNDIRARQAAGDLLFLASLRTHRLGDHFAIFGDTSVPGGSAGGEVAASQMKDQFAQARELVTGFTRAGVQVIIDLPKPVFRSPAFRCADWFNAGNPICGAGHGTQRSRDAVQQARQSVVQGLQELAALETGGHLWDLLPLLCPTPTCSAMVEGGPLYFDGDHLSGHGNERVFADFRRLVRTIPSPSVAPATAVPPVR